MKILNIDAFAQPKRKLSIDGKLYDVRDIDVQSFIDSLKLAEELETQGEQTPAQAIVQSVAAIKQSIPDLAETRIKAMSLEQMTMVLQFIRGDLDDQATAPVPTEGEAASAAPDTKS